MWLKQQPTTQGVATVDAVPSSKPWKNVVCPSCRAAVLKYQKLKDWWSSMRCWGLINYAGCEAWFKVTESLFWLYSYLILEPELRISFGWFSASCCSLELLLLGLPAGRVHWLTPRLGKTSLMPSVTGWRPEVTPFLQPAALPGCCLSSEVLTCVKCEQL